ncbi:Glutathione S-transferase dhar3, chloroplastic [Stylosanthes scabra]|uniref:Glutathione S-transferase dhar3, chloroplastic n=1 Tax=Stylosanthes scabra TaxID=79078 RepID=A0ABU6UF01_9FABA|nr:Glutathione S-transferase dhar3, chloroplastic [Stylosanthes scabra]
MSTVRIQAPACALYSTFNHLLHRPNSVVSVTRNAKNSGALRVVSMSSSPPSAPFEICVKASVTTPNKLGDCPFCQRVLLTLEEKHLPYDPKFVDLTNKPEWFLNINAEGKVPVIKLDEKWVSDSDIITQILEEKYPSPPLVTPPEKATAGSKIFSTFIGFLKSKDPNDGTEQALLSELSSFNDYLKENGPFVNGKDISAADLSLGPKLYHLEIALGHYKKWQVPGSLQYLKSYMKDIFSRESFIKTRAQPQDVIEGWRPKVEG